MPTYEYECKICGHNFEAFQSMSDSPLSECPECGKEIRRIINGGSGIIFKGSGFYVTDKNKSSSSSTAKKESKAPEKPTVASAPAAASVSADVKAPCASCPAPTSGSCPASDKTAG